MTIEGNKMTGKGHLATGFSLTFATYAFADTIGAIAWLTTLFSLFGSTAPDWLEIRRGGNTLIPHRTITHFVPLWVGLLLLSLFSVNPELFHVLSFLEHYALNEIIRDCLLGFAIGGLLHLLFDLPNPMGIPFLLPFHRISLGLWRSGEMEKTIVFFVLCFSLWYAYPILLP